MARLPRASFAFLLALLPAPATLIGAIVLRQIPSVVNVLGVALVTIGVAVHKPAPLPVPVAAEDEKAEPHRFKPILATSMETEPCIRCFMVSEIILPPRRAVVPAVRTFLTLVAARAKCDDALMTRGRLDGASGLN